MSAPTEASAAELKQQGAFEAARNPESSVTADDARKKAEYETKKAGVQALSFDPNATPEEKAAQARAVSMQWPRPGISTNSDSECLPTFIMSTNRKVSRSLRT